MSNNKIEPYHPVYNSTNYPHNGLTKREYFAALAMQGLLTRNEAGRNETLIAGDAVSCADELIRILNLRQ